MGGMQVSGSISYKVGDPHGKTVMDHIGGMNPGETKLVPAFDEPEQKKR
jgi:hypothetical protein